MMVRIVETHMEFMFNSEKDKISGLKFLRTDFFTHMDKLFSCEPVKWNVEFITKCAPHKP